MSRMVVCLVIASVLIAWASAACKPLESTELESGDCNCTLSSQVYDYRENACKDESDLYFYGGYGPFGNASGCRSGFTWNATTEQCDDIDECAMGTATCQAFEDCYNTVDQYHCGCKDIYYNTGDRCINVDESLNPLWNDCPQLVYDWTPRYICSCFNGTMFNDPQGNGRSCVLNPGYSNCTKETDTGVMCVESDNGEQFFFAMSGYKLDDTNSPEDINECLDMENKTLCWANAECQNLEAGGGYLCTCLPGYTDELFVGNIKECLLKKCARGEGLDCEDACDDFECQQDEFCVIQDNLPTCTNQFADAIFNKPPTLNIFTNSIVIWNPNESIGQVTQSLEMVFGAGNVQLVQQNKQEFGLNVQLSLTQNDVKERLNSHCVSLSQLPGYCELPLGIIIGQVTTDFALVEVCASEPCPTDTHDCIAGNRTCSCKDGGTQTYFNDNFELCDVATDLQQQLNDAEDAVKVTAAVLGTLLGLSLVVIVVLVFFKKGRFCSS